MDAEHTYFIIRRLDSRDPNWQHMYVVKSKYSQPPASYFRHEYNQKIVGVTHSLESLEAMQRLLINDSMRQQRYPARWPGSKLGF